LGINDGIELHPKCGLSWEGFTIHQIIKRLASDKNDTYFWRTNAGAELEMLIVKDNQKIGFEIKYALVLKVTQSMISAIDNLKLDKLFIVIPENDSYFVWENIQVIRLKMLNTYINL
jgi:predicted AAA+ superfamily ATPase